MYMYLYVVRHISIKIVLPFQVRCETWIRKLKKKKKAEICNTCQLFQKKKLTMATLKNKTIY